MLTEAARKMSETCYKIQNLSLAHVAVVVVVVVVHAHIHPQWKL